MRRDDSDRLFDQRVVRRNITAGRISKDDHKRYMEALPDATEKIKPPEEGGDDDGWDGPPPREPREAHPSMASHGGLPGLPRPDFGAAGLDDDDDDDLDDEDDDDDDDDDLDDEPVVEPPTSGGPSGDENSGL
jgi:hypothetical protein